MALAWSALKSIKSQTKQVVSLAGVYVARRFVSGCTGCGRIFQDPALSRWVAHGCRTAWDVLVFVGRRLFLDCHTSAQIRAELTAGLESVRDWLIRHGVQAARLDARGYGPDRPLVPNITPANRARNRRVQFNITEQDDN